MKGFIAFDLEGPLTPQDNAYELMKLIPQGGHIFEVISRYDDLLALEGREGYEAGDTLALIAPFLLAHGVTEKEVRRLAEGAPLVAGATELIKELKGRGWWVGVITTSYRPFAETLAERLSLPPQNLAATFFPGGEDLPSITPMEQKLLAGIEQEILAFALPGDERRMKERLDRFFWKEIPATGLGRVVAGVKPVGGMRKVLALEGFTSPLGVPLSDVAVVGDSITDAKILHKVRDAGGLAIAFNANEYALPYATMGLASASILDLEKALAAWEKGGKEEARRLVLARESQGGQGDRGHYHWLEGRESLEEALKMHQRLRRLVRAGAARLG